MLISEVHPASTSEPKNRMPNRPGANGSVLMMAGKATNARPTPVSDSSAIGAPDSRAMKPSTANTPMPHRISNEEFAKPTVNAEVVMSDLRLR